MKAEEKKEEERGRKAMATVSPPAVSHSNITATKIIHAEKRLNIALLSWIIMTLKFTVSDKQKRCTYASSIPFLSVLSRATRNKSFSSALNRAARRAVTPTPNPSNPCYIKVVIPQLKF